MKKNVLVNFRIEEDLKNDFAKLAESNGFTVSELITASILDMVKHNRVPSNILAKANRISKTFITIPYIKHIVSFIIETKYKGKIKKVSLFGSYAIGKEKRNSDIDLLIEQSKLSLFESGAFQNDLEKIFAKKVDVVFPPSNECEFLENVETEKIVIYEQK